MYPINSKYHKGARLLALSSIACAVLAGCGGGGGGATTTTTVASTSLTGTAATGAPIVGQVVAIDATGRQVPAVSTNSTTGNYTLNVAGYTAPFILMVTGTSNGNAVTLTSVATAPGQTVNITPLTDLIVSTAAGQPGGMALVSLCSTPASLAQCQSALTTATTGTHLSAAVTAVTNMIAPLNAAGTDPLNGAFVADGTGMDGALDKILVTPASGQGATATVSLIAVPAQQLGSVIMPATAGGIPTSPPSIAAPSATLAANIITAGTANTALSEIQVCLASFSALYPANMTAAPTSAQVTPFIDTTFSMGGSKNQAWMITNMSTLASLGTGGFAQPGFSVIASGFSPFDFTLQSATTTLLTTTPSVSTSAAWVQMNAPLVSDGLMNWKMLKGAAYAGCPGGWKVAADGHLRAHMQARVNRWNFSNTVTYTRELPFHVQTNEAMALGIGSIVVKGPGLSVYSGTPAAPVAPSTPANSLILVTPAVPTAPAVQWPAMGINGHIGVNASYYGNADALQSCQDMALIVAPATLPPAGTPCYDDTAVVPGTVYKYIVYGTGAPAAGTLLYSFPFQISAVPLSRAFVIANDAYLFAQSIAAAPQGVSALNSAAAGYATAAKLDSVITFNYTQSAVYGARTNTCGIGVTDATNVLILQAEQNAVGQQTACTFTPAGLNSGSLAKPATAFGGIQSYMYVGNHVLGNSAVSSQPY